MLSLSQLRIKILGINCLKNIIMFRYIIFQKTSRNKISSVLSQTLSKFSMQTLTLSTMDLKPEPFYASVLKTTKEQSSPKTKDSSKTPNSEYTNLQKKNLKGESNPPLNLNPNQRSSSLTVPRSWLSYVGFLSTQALMRSTRSSKTFSMCLAR